MANARVIRGLGNNSAFARQVETLSARKAKPILDAVARQAVIEFDAIVREDFVNDRPAHRRRTGRHLLGSSNARVLPGDGRSIAKISLGSTAEGKKLGALNYGSPEHGIDGSPLAFPVAEKWNKGGRNKTKVTPMKFTGRQSAYLPTRGGNTVVVDHVDHPGNAPHYMMERALERAVEKVLHQRVAIKRR